jgi:hypothetical protein
VVDAGSVSVVISGAVDGDSPRRRCPILPTAKGRYLTMGTNGNSAPGLQSPFADATPPRARNALERFLHIGRSGLASAAVRALLSENQRSECQPAAVSEVLRSYGVSGNKARDALRSVWKEALASFLDDGAVSDAELAYLQQLKCLLVLPDSVTDAAMAELVDPKYRDALEKALEDGVLSPAEKEHLSALQRALRIPQATRNRILGEEAGPLLQRVLKGLMADQRISDDDEAVLKHVCENLGVEMRLDATTKATLDRYKLFWRIENGHFPEIEAPVHLYKGEACYFVAPGRWAEWRSRTHTVGYSSSGVSFRVMRGVYYRVGASHPHRVTTEGLEAVDTGSVIITSRRVIFDGDRKNGNWRLASLLGFEAYADGFSLEKASGRNPVFQITGDAELAAVILGASLARA